MIKGSKALLLLLLLAWLKNQHACHVNVSCITNGFNAIGLANKWAQCQCDGLTNTIELEQLEAGGHWKKRKS